MDDVRKDRAVAETATVFEDGDGQAVRLPDGYRFDTNKVEIWKDGDRVYLKPAPPKENDWAWIDDLQGFSDDMVESILKDRPGPEAYERPDFNLDE